MDQCGAIKRRNDGTKENRRKTEERQRKRENRSEKTEVGKTEVKREKSRKKTSKGQWVGYQRYYGVGAAIPVLGGLQTDLEQSGSNELTGRPRKGKPGGRYQD